MKKGIIVLFVGICLIAMLSCKKEGGLYDVPSTPEQAEAEYLALPELPLLKVGEVNLSTNFVEVGDRINYGGQTVIRKVTPLYGSGDVLLVVDGGILVILYQTSTTISAMKYDYVITGVRVDKAKVYIKGVRTNGKDVFIKYDIDTSHEYLYKYL